MSESGVFVYTDSCIQEDIPRDVTHVKIDASAEVIDDRAFKNCKDLRTVDFTDATSLMMIGEEAFAGCVSLKEADLTGLPELQYICHRAFQGCNLLEIVGKLPAKLDRVGESAFEQESREFVEANDDSRPSFKALDFSSAKFLRYIYSGAFANCKFENEVKFPANLQAIADKAFEGAIMHRLVFSCAESLRFIGEAAFSNSQVEGQVKFPPMLETIGDDAFNGSSVPQIDFSSADSLKKIGVSAFEDCKFETEVRLPASLEELGEEAFTGSSMQGLDLSVANKLKVIGRWSFARCNIQDDVKFSSRLEAISQRSFTGSSMRRLDFSRANSLRVIGHSAFASCKIEDEVEFPEALEEIWPLAFAKARTSSVNLSMCKHLKRNEENAFDGMISTRTQDTDEETINVNVLEEETTTKDLSTEESEKEAANEKDEGADDSPTRVSNEKGHETVNKEHFNRSTTSTLKVTEEEEEELEEPLPSSDVHQKAPSSSLSTIVKKGWLEKKCKKRSMFLQPVWERRYFMLQEDGVLIYGRTKFSQGETRVRTKRLTNVVVEKSQNGNHYEVRDRVSSRKCLCLRVPAQGSKWEPSKHNNMASSSVSMSETHGSSVSLGLLASSALQQQQQDTTVRILPAH